MNKGLMAILREYIWVWVIIGMIFACTVISLIFILINKCISRAGKHRISELQRRANLSVTSNKYQERTTKADIPPLPPRTQFLTAEAQSYENLAEVPDYVQSMPDYVQATPDYEESTPDYVQATPDYEESTPDYEESTPDYVQATPDYEESTPDYVQATPDFEESMPDYEECTPDYEESTPDYVDMDEEEKILPPPAPYKYPDPAADNVSMDDYDDIGEENQGEEDYDDVG